MLTKNVETEIKNTILFVIVPKKKEKERKKKT